jgi:hypothetical protein
MDPRASNTTSINVSAHSPIMIHVDLTYFGRTPTSERSLSHVDNNQRPLLGSRFAERQRLLPAVSDDNFKPLQITQFAVFEFTG